MSIIYMYEGLEYAAESDFEDARSSFIKCLNYDPCNMEVIFYLHLLNDPERYQYLPKMLAIKISKTVLADSLRKVIETGDYDAYSRALFSALLLEKKRNMILARESYSQAIAIDSSQAYLYYLRGNTALQLGNYSHAITDFTKALNCNSCSFRLYYQRGFAFYRQFSLDKAIADFQTALSLAPLLKNALHESLVICEAFNKRGIKQIQNGKYQDALADLNAAILIHPRFSEPYLNRGIAYRNLNIYEAALEDFNMAISLNDKYIDAYFNRALTFKDMSQSDRAVRDLKTVVILDTSYFQAYYQLGNIFFEQDDFYAAIDTYSKCLQIDSTYIWAYYKRAQSYDRLRKFPGAIHDYDYFFAHAPDSYLDQKVNAWERSKLLKEWLEQRK